MPLQLIRLDSHPREVVATKVAHVSPQAAFFLDFTRPLNRQRLLGIGPALGLLVPVVHQSEREGGYVFGLRRGDPYFTDIQALWRQRYPAKRSAFGEVVSGLTVAADFAVQFPEDSK